MPEWGFTDAISAVPRRTPRRRRFGERVREFYAAVPSMHVCFAVMTAFSMRRLVRHRTAEIAWSLYPLWITLWSSRPATTTSPMCSWRAHRRRLRDPRKALARARAAGRLGVPTSYRDDQWRRPHPGRRPAPHPSTAQRRPDHPGVRSQPADRVAADTERDLADRTCAQPRRGRADRRIGCSSSPASRSSSARSWTRSTGATRGCRARARRSARSSTRRSTGSRRGSCSPRSPSLRPSHNHRSRGGRRRSAASLMVSYTRARAEALGVECKVGLATRPVRVVILSAGLVFARGASLGHF